MTQWKILSVKCKCTMEVSAEYNDSKCKLIVKAPEAGENGGQNERTFSQFRRLTWYSKYINQAPGFK